MPSPPWKNSKISIDRYKVLLGWSRAKAAALDMSLPEHIRAGYRKARDHAAVALSMQDAAARAEARKAAETSSAETPPPK